MRKLFFFFIISVSALGLRAQSDAQFTHFAFNKLAYNPAYVGSKGAFDLSGIYRKQWSGIDGAPQTMNFNMHTPFAAGRNAVGLSVLRDEIGQIATTGVDLYYAYHIRFKENNRLSIGLQGRIEQAEINWSHSDPLDLVDRAIPSADENAYAPNFGLGAYYYGDKFFVGVSAPRLLKNSLYFENKEVDKLRTSIRTYYTMAGAVVRIGQQVQMLPSLLVSYNPNAPVDVDLNTNLRFFDSFWIGGSYRLGDSVDGLIGYEFKNGLRLGFAYDYTTSELEKATNGSYEFMLGYTFKCKDCNVAHVRYF